MTTTFAPPDGGPHPLLADLTGIIHTAARFAPRSQQVYIGPSEIGQPCQRRLALKLIGAEDRNPQQDRWAATIGTAVHSWLEEAFTKDNMRRAEAGLPHRWVTEHRVTIRDGLSGTTDLYDLETETVVDWKVVGNSSLKKYIKDPGQQYKVQGQAYGLGWHNRGRPVKRVAIVFLPRTGWLADSHIWIDEFRPQVALDALTRIDQLIEGMNIAEHLGALEDFLELLPRDASSCAFCPYKTRDLSVSAADGCMGANE